MLIIPAIDLKDGRCVRLTQGRMDEETVYSTDPAQIARRWAGLGARLIHLVDLDGAVEGGARNFSAIREIIDSIDVPVQIGGGIRDEKTAKAYLDIERVKRIIIGTAACEDPSLLEALTKRYPGRVAVGIDAKDGMAAIKGWVEVTGEKAVDLAQRLEGRGVACIIYTDISRDGMLKGPNVEATREIAESVIIPVVASGGISSLKDIESYRGVKLEGIIIGKALYSGDIDLKEAIKAAGAQR
ncbi:MAG: 1-(5-phosphoribosyl)-5-[(5-phosphoribosylamino)methylideneamino]imidazole-4-carboxamide isomerase [Deltaproteobacteria bacterium]|nr:1-(5-phosphoribosyl)-5-[(5-phosphoribosylamino)methylideneamino]imidazole-4-carboxamide isomerase [Deltaproteobacteria bacterium]